MKKIEKNKSKSAGFTLIEVLVASLLLSSVFFVILKFVSNNTYQSTKIQNSKTMDELFLSSKACIESFSYHTGTTTTQSLNFGANNLECLTGNYNDGLSFTGISLRTTNDTETGALNFWSYFSIQDNNGTLKAYNIISDGTEKKNIISYYKNNSSHNNPIILVK